MRKIQCIGILTSGGDAPGMNAAIRAVTRAAIANGFRVMAIYRGYEGLINDEIKEFTTENVSNIIQRGGTILKTARSKEFQTPEGRQKAFDNMQKRGIDALVVIGGNGSLSGCGFFCSQGRNGQLGNRKKPLFKREKPDVSPRYRQTQRPAENRRFTLLLRTAQIF